MIPAGERIPSGDPSNFLAKYSYKQGNKEGSALRSHKVGCSSGESCRSFAKQRVSSGLTGADGGL